MAREWKEFVKEIAKKAQQEGLGMAIWVEEREGTYAITGAIEKISEGEIKLQGSHLIPYDRIVSFSFNERIYKKDELCPSF